MQNGDETLPNIIVVGQGLLVKMLITLEKHHLCWSEFACLYIFEIGRQNDKEKKRYKEKIGYAWIPTTVPQAVGLKTSL